MSRTVESDMDTIPADSMKAGSDDERVTRLLAHVFLRLWTRMALESGYRLKSNPSQFDLGNYGGQMKWVLNEAIDYKTLDRLELAAKFGRRHMLVAESYEMKGQGRVRVFFSLEEEQVKSQPVFVNYLVYDEPAKAFSVKELMSALKPALPRWMETIMQRSDEPLWDYCKEELECVGV